MPLPENVEPIPVSVLTNRIKLRLEEHFPEVWVAGEVSNFVRASSGHLYFSLKDARSTLRCAMFRGFALRTRFDLRDGMEIVAKGEVSVFEQRGEYQLIVKEVQPKGIGAAELALQQLKDRLRQRGYFDPKRKRKIHRYPRRIALVASPTGAAIRDMLEILTHRWPLADVIVCPSRVQGDGAAENIAAVLRRLSDLHRQLVLPLSAIVLGRGGGSSEDLAAFNEECVADAIFESAVPVVSAVGHEIDVSIADYVADVRALTPSDAIRMLCPDREEMMDDLVFRFDRMREAIGNKLRLAQQRVRQAEDRPALRRPFDRVRTHEQRLDELAGRLGRAVRQAVRRGEHQLAAVAERLESLSPLNVLGRGYSLTQQADGVHLVRDAADVRPGDRIVTRVARGEIVSRVESARPLED